MANRLSKSILLSLVILFCTNCNKDELDCDYDYVLEIMFYEEGENRSNNLILDSISLNYDCQRTINKTINISQSDSSLIYGLRKACCYYPFAPPVSDKVIYYATYGIHNTKLAEFNLTIERVTIDGVEDCNVISADSDSSAYDVVFSDNKIILKILN